MPAIISTPVNQPPCTQFVSIHLTWPQSNRGSDDLAAAWSAINEITEQDNGIASLRRNGFQKCVERGGATVYVPNRKCSASQV